MMTSTSSAAATGLPDRRHILSTFVGASALGLGVSLPAANAAAHPDAELIQLDVLLISAAELHETLDARCDQALDGYRDPPIPDTLMWRQSDFPGVWIDRGRLDGIGAEGTAGQTYASEGVLQTLRQRLAEWRSVAPLDRTVGERTVARVEEIVAGLEAWHAEEAKGLAACGYTAADADRAAHQAFIFDLFQRIAALPARTPDGICVKARAALFASLREPGAVERHVLPALLAKTDRRWDETEDLLNLSLMVDAARLGAPSNERRAA